MRAQRLHSVTRTGASVRGAGSIGTVVGRDRVGDRRARTHGVQSPYVRDSSIPDRQPQAEAVCRHYPADCTDRSHVLIGRWTTATLRMTCLTGGRTPCSAATGIPGRRATSLSPMCGAHAAPTKASPGTPWSGARPTAAAQPGTARAHYPPGAAPSRDTGVSDPRIG